ncbi:DNA gyrase, A subunit, partial [Chlamydia psittaci 08-2626_L3]
SCQHKDRLFVLTCKMYV